MNEWQPIDTYPLGENVLVFEAVDDEGGSTYIYKNGSWVGKPIPQYKGVITHWMPLPRDPRKKHKCKKDNLYCIRDFKGELCLCNSESQNYFFKYVSKCPMCGESA